MSLLWVFVLAGQMSFKEFVSKINSAEAEEEEEGDLSSANEESEVDEEWEPPGKKVKAAAPVARLEHSVGNYKFIMRIRIPEITNTFFAYV